MGKAEASHGCCAHVGLAAVLAVAHGHEKGLKSSGILISSLQTLWGVWSARTTRRKARKP